VRRLKITAFKMYKVKPRWLFLKVETDEGIAGWGEPIVEGRADTVEACVRELGEYLIGKSPLRIEDHWQTLYRGGFYRGGPILTSAISGIEQALWDIAGKYYGLPVWQMLGGAARDKIRHTTAPIATGERQYTRWGFKQILMDGYVDIIQPDLSHAGGILEVKKISAMAEAFDVAVAPHCPLGPIALASSLQVDACTPNAVIQEQSLGIHYNRGSDLLDYLADPSVFAYEDGFVGIPAKAGLGIEINEEKVQQAAMEGHNWKNPVWRHEDGSVAEW
jgi:L-alanine-DL-glutamate epimerase-like enolase superfamily enzyme